MPALVTSLTVPARSENVRIIRTIGADAASAADVTFDRLDDLELALSEAFTMLLSGRPAAATLELRSESGQFDIELRAIGPQQGIRPNEVSNLVLGALVEDMHIERSGRVAFTFRTI